MTDQYYKIVQIICCNKIVLKAQVTFTVYRAIFAIITSDSFPSRRHVLNCFTSFFLIKTADYFQRQHHSNYAMFENRAAAKGIYRIWYQAPGRASGI